MPEEYFDIVDENNQPTGQKATRQEAHTKGLWHRSVQVYCVRKNSDGEVDFLVHLRSKTKGRNPGRWDTRFGGHVKAGETVEEAALGELKEEAGIMVPYEALKHIPVRSLDYGVNKEFVYAHFLVGDREIGSLSFQDGEVEEAKWMAGSDIIHSMRKNPENWGAGIETFIDVNTLAKKMT
jgi:isopentenyldiphosphate isomerase